MCEQFIARSGQPFQVSELFGLAEGLERYGIAGFGWGAAWIAAPGRLVTYRDVRAFHDDPGRDAIGSIETTSLLVHLRRPSRLSTLTLADTQPFADPDGRFAFSHNGDLRNYRQRRTAFQAAGRIHGQADTEVGARWLEDTWQADTPVGELLGDLHRTFSGPANLAVLAADGSAYHYAGNEENPVFSFRLGSIEIASTGIYSLDRSLFRYVAPGGRDRQRVELTRTAVLA
jgi:glutamine phosphoribosylpyrophosphate amidotransferase